MSASRFGEANFCCREMQTGGQGMPTGGTLGSGQERGEKASEGPGGMEGEKGRAAKQINQGGEKTASTAGEYAAAHLPAIDGGAIGGAEVCDLDAAPYDLKAAVCARDACQIQQHVDIPPSAAKNLWRGGDPLVSLHAQRHLCCPLLFPRSAFRSSLPAHPSSLCRKPPLQPPVSPVSLCNPLPAMAPIQLHMPVPSLTLTVPSAVNEGQLRKTPLSMDGVGEGHQRGTCEPSVSFRVRVPSRMKVAPSEGP